jgi:preprotein translocase subunit SecA
MQWVQRLDRQKQQKASPKTVVGRNDPCPCGSGKKYKNCCMKLFEV